MAGRRAVLNAAVLGFAVTVLCYFGFFVMFNATGPAAKAFYVIVAIVCPVLAMERLSGPGWMMAVLPLLNAALYAAVTWLFLTVRRRAPASTG